jgi:hypothetical protein
MYTRVIKWSGKNAELINVAFIDHLLLNTAHGNIVDTFLAVSKSLPVFGSNKLVKREIEEKILGDYDEIMHLLKEYLTVGRYLFF